MLFDPDDDDDDLADPDYNFSSEDDTSENEVVEHKGDNQQKKKNLTKLKEMVPKNSKVLTEKTKLENDTDNILPGIIECNEENKVDKNTECKKNEVEKNKNIDSIEIIDHQIENVDENPAIDAHNNMAVVVTDDNQENGEKQQEVREDGNLNDKNKKKKIRARTSKERQENERGKHPLIEVLECCTKKCFSVFSEDERRQVHIEFWELNRDCRKLWINNHVFETLAKRKMQDTRRTYTRSYKLPVLKETGKSTFPVCQQFFLKTLGFQSTSIVDHTLKCCKDEHGNRRLTPLQDQRGRHFPKNKKDLTDLREHIKSYKPIPSHYKREHAPNRLYLPSDLTIKMMHLDYNQKFSQNPVGYELYRKTLDEMNIAFYNVHSVKCGFCIKVDMDPTPENLADKEVHLNEVSRKVFSSNNIFT